MKGIERIVVGYFGVVLLIFTTCANKNGVDEQIALQQWKAGAKVTLQNVNAFGIERCFVGEEINDSIFNAMCGQSFKANCTTDRQELRYIKVLHYNLDRQICLGEMVCHKDIAGDLIDIFRVLYDAQYPIEKMVLIDSYNAADEASCADNNSSAFNFRFIAGTTKLSSHSTGRAVDINPRFNPYVKWINEKCLISPINGASYVDRAADFPYKIDSNDLCLREFAKRGFIWGGDWVSLKDYMHFEKPL